MVKAKKSSKKSRKIIISKEAIKNIKEKKKEIISKELKKEEEEDISPTLNTSFIEEEEEKDLSKIVSKPKEERTLEKNVADFTTKKEEKEEDTIHKSGSGDYLRANSNYNSKTSRYEGSARFQSDFSEKKANDSRIPFMDNDAVTKVKPLINDNYQATDNGYNPQRDEFDNSFLRKRQKGF